MVSDRVAGDGTVAGGAVVVRRRPPHRTGRRRAGGGIGSGCLAAGAALVDLGQRTARRQPAGCPSRRRGRGVAGRRHPRRRGTGGRQGAAQSRPGRQCAGRHADHRCVDRRMGRTGAAVGTRWRGRQRQLEQRAVPHHPDPGPAPQARSGRAARHPPHQYPVLQPQAVRPPEPGAAQQLVRIRAGRPQAARRRRGAAGAKQRAVAGCHPVRKPGAGRKRAGILSRTVRAPKPASDRRSAPDRGAGAPA